MFFGVLRLIKDFITYDADREFYAKVFPDSVSKVDLMRLRKMRKVDLARVMEIETKNYTFPWSEDIFKKKKWLLMRFCQWPPVKLIF